MATSMKVLEQVYQYMCVTWIKSKMFNYAQVFIEVVLRWAFLKFSKIVFHLFPWNVYVMFWI